MPIDECSTTVEVAFPSDTDGKLRLTVHYPGHMSMALDWPMALRYALAVLRAVAHAEHDAAVIGQMRRQLGQTPETAAHVVQRLRAERPALDAEALGVLRLEPSVLVPSCTPFLRCSTAGGATWAWPTLHAVEHATSVLLSGPATDLAHAYKRFLVSRIGVGGDEARCAVADLSRWRYWTAGAKLNARAGDATAETFTCPACGAVSHNPRDAQEGYCGNCHWFTGDPVLAEHRPVQDPTPR